MKHVPTRCALLVGFMLLAAPAVALAGMPATLPSDLPTRLRLQEWAVDRLGAISFFVSVIGVCTFLVNVLWNHLQRDFTWLPRIGMISSFALVFLWGLLFVIVLTMISGARELMTPGAWQKQGFTYKLKNAPPISATDDGRAEIARLRTALWLWAGAHEGELPAALDELGDDLTINVSRYRYFAGRTLHGKPEFLLGPASAANQPQWALRTDGEIVLLSPQESAALAQGDKP